LRVFGLPEKYSHFYLEKIDVYITCCKALDKFQNYAHFKIFSKSNIFGWRINTTTSSVLVKLKQ